MRRKLPPSRTQGPDSPELGEPGAAPSRGRLPVRPRPGPQRGPHRCRQGAEDFGTRRGSEGCRKGLRAKQGARSPWRDRSPAVTAESPGENRPLRAGPRRDHGFGRSAGPRPGPPGILAASALAKPGHSAPRPVSSPRARCARGRPSSALRTPHFLSAGSPGLSLPKRQPLSNAIWCTLCQRLFCLYAQKEAGVLS